ncbi:MAG: class II fructose-bisphosphate aldolase family protein [Ignavibacteriae bacterium]|nr:class II fructose-bisphosphate aldolase family protein [Ignavibacteriota bacterium]
MKISLQKLYEKYYGSYGIPAFNVFTAEQVMGVFKGANKAELPIIIAITPAARNYISHEMLQAMISAAAILYPNVEFSVHLDHGNIDHCINAINSGFYDSVMIDASHETFENNISITSEIVNRAHEKGIAVEAELGVLSGVEDNINVSEFNSRFTDPDQASEFIKRTNIDSLAVAIGTSHGAYKLQNVDGLQFNILEKINNNQFGFPIVLHGASNVSKSEIIRINDVGGKLQNSAKGIEIEQIRRAIKLGISKINIATDLRLLWTRVHREFFMETPELFDPTIPGEKYINEISKLVYIKCISFFLGNNLDALFINTNNIMDYND